MDKITSLLLLLCILCIYGRSYEESKRGRKYIHESKLLHAIYTLSMIGFYYRTYLSSYITYYVMTDTII